MNSSESYKEIVNKAISLVEKVEIYQLEIARLATKACTIRHGGKSNGFYTLTDFASDIGVNRKTLSGWVQVYCDVVQKIDIEVESFEQWSRCSKVNNILRMNRRNVNKKNSKQGTRDAFKKEIPSKDVKHIYENLDKKVESRELHNISNRSINILGKLKKLNLNRVDQFLLLSVMNTLDEASEIINKFLTEQRDLKKKKRTDS